MSSCLISWSTMHLLPCWIFSNLKIICTDVFAPVEIELASSCMVQASCGAWRGLHVPDDRCILTHSPVGGELGHGCCRLDAPAAPLALVLESLVDAALCVDVRSEVVANEEAVSNVSIRWSAKVVHYLAELRMRLRLLLR